MREGGRFGTAVTCHTARAACRAVPAAGEIFLLSFFVCSKGGESRGLDEVRLFFFFFFFLLASGKEFWFNCGGLGVLRR